jgi:hypothetical protein
MSKTFAEKVEFFSFNFFMSFSPFEFLLLLLLHQLQWRWEYQLHTCHQVSRRALCSVSQHPVPLQKPRPL